MSTPDERSGPVEQSSDAVDRLILEELTAPGPYETSRPMTVAELYALLREHQDLKKRLLCPPERFEALSAAVADAGLAPFIDVVAHRFLDGDAVIFAASVREMQEMLQAKLEADLHRHMPGGRRD